MKTPGVYRVRYFHGGKIMFKRFFILLLLVSLALRVFAGGQTQKTPGETAAGGKTEIRVYWWGDTVRHNLYNQILDEFEKANPNIKTIREPTSWADYWDKLAIQTAGGNAPEFMGMHQQYASDYLSRGVCEPLDDYIAKGILSTDGWEQGTLDTGKYNGKLYMMAMGVTFSSAFMNNGIFREIGVTPPGFNWTWDDARRIGLQTRAALDNAGKKNAYMLTDLSGGINEFRYFVRQRGREVYGANGNISCTEQDVSDWWTMFKEFRDQGIVPDAETQAEFTGTVLEDGLFARDRVLIAWVPINQFALYNRTFPSKDITIIRHASTADGKVGEWPEGAHFAVNARSTQPKKDAAVALINFWVNDPKSLALFKLDQGVPGNLKVDNEVVVPLLDEYQKAMYDFVMQLSRIASPTINPPTGASEIQTLFQTIAEQISYNVITPAAGARQFMTEANAIRARAR
jgi:multiple sugar transport system substrate-binding protein